MPEPTTPAFPPAPGFPAGVVHEGKPFPNCEFCGGPLQGPVHKDLWQCARCGNRVLLVRPTKEEAWNQNRKFMLKACSKPAKAAARIKDANEGQLDLLEKFVQPSRLYDVGAAGGFFMKAARDRGWEVGGNELSSSSVNWAKKVYDLDIFCGYLEDAGVPDAVQDAVVMWNVLEHVVDPVLTLQHCHRILKPNGCILIKVPTKEHSALVRHYEWKHFTEFTLKGLHAALVGAGFMRKVLERSTADKVNHTIALYRK